MKSADSKAKLGLSFSDKLIHQFIHYKYMCGYAILEGLGFALWLLNNCIHTVYCMPG